MRLVSFTFRLFGNMFAGEVVILMFTFLTPLIITLPFYGLEMFVGVIQAFIFAIADPGVRGDGGAAATTTTRSTRHEARTNSRNASRNQHDEAINKPAHPQGGSSGHSFS